ncbi:hypothetical protein PRIPAC_81827 [Pristionchus pacificus]|nr:hypothetical protein PRIPAC_81827 [Pristionchus pacificus]
MKLSKISEDALAYCVSDRPSMTTTPNCHHRRASSYWTPNSAPLVEQLPSVSNLTSLFFRRREPEDTRLIVPNPAEDCSRYQLPNYIKYSSNEISTTKYNPVTFIPRNLWEQFHRLANIYFVFLLGVDAFPMFNTSSVFVSALPVIFILVLTAIKDALEDMRRRRLDSKVNNATCHVWDKNANRFRKMKWKHILVGDIVHISNDEFLPADILLLRSSAEDGNAFVETSNLDGESNLKHRNVPKIFSDYCGEDITLDDSFLRLKIASAPPSKEPSEMRGSMEMNGRSETFTPENSLLRGCRLKNTTFVEGIVIYAGHDTKMMLSSGRAPYKRSHAEIKTNTFVIGCAGMLAILIAITATCRALWVGGYPDPSHLSPPFALLVPAFNQDIGPPPDWLSSIGSSLVLYQIMIPLALYITVELIKLGQVYFMQQDVKMYCEEKDEAFIARSLSMGEELGQLTHLLSDKTGTLTQNKMLLRRCATVYSECAVGNNPVKFPDRDVDFEHLLKNMIACNTVFVQKGKRRDVIDDQDTPSFNDVSTIGAPSSYAYSDIDLMEERLSGPPDLYYEGESPDELALVWGARRFGWCLESRSNNIVTYKDHDGRKTMLKVLCTLPFDTERKRMSVCVVGDNEDEVIVYSKGADSSMIGKAGKRVKRESESALKSIEEDEEDNVDDDKPMKPSREEVLKSRVEEYARMGLRTLVMGMRVMRRTEFDEWMNHKNFVELARNRGNEKDEESEKMMREMADRIETPTRVIGVTAVEDKLQANVARSITALREAKIQVWVLTGDQPLTAEGVATACGLFRNIPVHFKTDSEERYAGEDVLVAPDQVTQMCLPESTALDRLEGCGSVLCYRLTPGHKAEIVKAVKRRGGVVAAIGDGANDVPMIQAAHVGIGISGLEGSQASMAADFVLAQFSFVSRLILVHGHWNYARIAHVMLYFFYKNIQNVMITFFIQVFNGWSCGFPVNMIFSVCYPVIFTSLQPIIFGVMDQDRTEKELVADPTLYEAGRDGELYNVKQFLSTIADAVWQGAVCYGTMHVFCTDTFHSAQYFGFCLAIAMFCVNMAHLILETRCLNIVVLVIHVAGFVVTLSFFLLWDLLTGDEYMVAEDALNNLYFYAAVFFATVVSLVPRFIIRVLLNSDAEIGQQIIETVQTVDSSELSYL